MTFSSSALMPGTIVDPLFDLLSKQETPPSLAGLFRWNKNQNVDRLFLLVERSTHQYIRVSRTALKDIYAVGRKIQVCNRAGLL
jgi:hypothetical protein